MSLADNGLAAGVLPAGAVAVVNVPRNTITPRMTATLMSAAVGRKIELSTNGVEYFEGVYDVSSATMMVIGIQNPVSFVRFTGAVADAYQVQS